MPRSHGNNREKKAMSSLLVPRALHNSICQIVRSKPNHYGLIRKRSASTKHPRGFAPPSVEDLSELRERVQEFTRKHPILIDHCLSLISF